LVIQTPRISCDAKGAMCEVFWHETTDIPMIKRKSSRFMRRCGE